MLFGLDLSHWNYNMKNYDLSAYDFVILKATQGRSYKDNRMHSWIRALDQSGVKLRGFYHFADPQKGNTPEQEALHFINTVIPYLDGNAIVALDVEADALRYPNLDKWVAQFCQIVEVETGIKPMIYCSAAECKRFPSAADMGCGLWVAKWSKNKPTEKQIAPFKFFAIWQYTDNATVNGVRCDGNYFNGSEEQYLKYCERRVL